MSDIFLADIIRVLSLIRSRRTALNQHLFFRPPPVSDVFRSAIAFLGRTAIARFVFSMRAILQEARIQVYAEGMRSQTRQNSFISGGVPKETRTKVLMEGKRRAIRTLFFLKCSMISTAGRAVLSMAKFV